MKLYQILFITSAIFLSSCVNNQAQDEQIVELTQQIRQIKNNLDDISYQLNSHNVELEILDGKFSGQNVLLNNIKESINNTVSKENITLKNDIATLKQSINSLEKNNKDIVFDIKNIQKYYNEATKTINTQNNLINNIEQDNLQQNIRINKIMESLDIISTLASSSNTTQYIHYKVLSGDSLEKIAKKFKISVHNIKDNNNLESDLIIAGQILKIPSKE